MGKLQTIRGPHTGDILVSSQDIKNGPLAFNLTQLVTSMAGFQVGYNNNGPVSDLTADRGTRCTSQSISASPMDTRRARELALHAEICHRASVRAHHSMDGPRPLKAESWLTDQPALSVEGLVAKQARSATGDHPDVTMRVCWPSRRCSPLGRPAITT
jgi:hypothetical protein